MKFLCNLAYVLVLNLARRIAVAWPRPKTGRIVEFEDELGLWWVEDDDSQK